MTEAAAAPTRLFVANWVMEPEVPRPPGTFLQFPTQRCFMEDRIDARITIANLEVSQSASVTINVFIPTPAFPESNLILVSTDRAEVDRNKKSFRFSELRPLKAFPSIVNASEEDSRTNILFDVNRTAGVTSLVTSIVLPVVDSDTDCVFEFTIRDSGVTVTGRSPNLRVVRWFVKPEDNLQLGPTEATKILPLLDGEAFFNKVKELIDHAEQEVLISSWLIVEETILNGEPNGPGERVTEALRKASDRNVRVFVLLDFQFGGGAENLADNVLNKPNIFVRRSTHRFDIVKVSALLGPLGSYHEKYVIVDKKTALVGGIDFHPERYNNQDHNFKSATSKFGLEGVFKFWHDADVLVEGPVVDGIYNDFQRRWTETVALGRKPAISPSPVQQRKAGRQNVQAVKSDLVESSLPPIGIGTKRKTVEGTRRAYEAAIAEARHYIYIENQYFNHNPVGELIVRALNQSPELQLIVVIPFATEEAAKVGKREFISKSAVQGLPERREIEDRFALHGEFLQKQLIDKLRNNVTNSGSRVGIFTLASHATGQTRCEDIYPHSKIMIVDDTWAIIGSANFNGRAFDAVDGEMNIVIHSRPEVTDLRKRLWKEQLGVDIETRQIREFFKVWNQKALRGFISAGDIPAATLDQAKVHAVHLTNPRPGQRYNGQFEHIAKFLGVMDKLV